MGAFAAHDFSLSATLESGQLFRYSLGSDGFYSAVVGNSILKLRQQRNEISCHSSRRDFDVEKFLGIRQDYPEILSSIGKDVKISSAIENHLGLRILEQEPWECTASFICSSFSNIPRIKQCIEKISVAFGDGIEFDGFKTFSFPQPHQINSLAKLKKCGLGYRAKYLFDSAKMFGDNKEFSTRQMRKLSYPEAKKRMMELPGVGEKVADCILLFSYGFFESFPVDVWVHRAMTGSYGREIKSFVAEKKIKSKITEKVVAEFARSYFGEYAGYAQQFLFHDARTQKKTTRAILTL